MTSVLITSDVGRAELDKAITGMVFQGKVNLLEPFDFNVEKLKHLPLYILSSIGGNESDMKSCIKALHYSKLSSTEDLLREFYSCKILSERVKYLCNNMEISIAIELKNIHINPETFRPLIRLFKFFTRDNPKIILFTEISKIDEGSKKYFDEVLS